MHLKNIHYSFIILLYTLSIHSVQFNSVAQSCPTLCNPLHCSSWISSSSSPSITFVHLLGFPGGASSKEPAWKCGRLRDVHSVPWSGRSLGGKHGNSFQYSCLKNPMDRGAWWSTVLRGAKSWTQLKWLGTHLCSFINEGSVFFLICKHGLFVVFAKY